MDVVLLLLLFGFIALAIWLGYLGYTVVKKRRAHEHRPIDPNDQ